MIVDFGDYKYYSLNNKDKNTYNGLKNDAYKQLAFNPTIFQNKIAEGDYQGAADYASNYKLNDVKQQRQFDNYISNIRREGRILSAIRQKVTDPDDLAKIEFADKVFVDGGLETIQNNPYAKKFANIKSALGNGYIFQDDYGHKEKIVEATSLSIRFLPEKQSLFGLDWLKKDNTIASIEKFYADSGFTEAQLKAYGVEISHPNGDTVLKFDKSNPLANKILYYTPLYANRQHMRGTLDGASDYRVNINGYDKNGNLIEYGLKLPVDDIGELQYIIKGSKSKKEELFEINKLTDKTYSSTVGAPLDDNIEYYNSLLQSGEIDETEYKRIYGRELDQISNAIRAIGNEYEFYSNAYNKKWTDRTLDPIEDEAKKVELINKISSAKTGTLHFHSMVSNGKIGTLISIDAVGKTDEKLDNNPDNNNPENSIKDRQYLIFIPGLFQDLCQEKINQNTLTRAAQEINSMQDYSYGYKLKDGSEVIPDGQGTFIWENQTISADEAIRKINKDMAIEDAENNLQYKFINKDNGLIDGNAYEQAAKQYAVAVVNEMYPNNPITSVEQAFNMKGSGNLVSDEYASKIQYEDYDRLNEVYDIYSYLMNVINFYREK